MFSLKNNLFVFNRKSLQKKRKIIKIESESDEDDDDLPEEMNKIQMILCDDGPQQPNGRIKSNNFFKKKK